MAADQWLRRCQHGWIRTPERMPWICHTQWILRKSWQEGDMLSPQKVTKQVKDNSSWTAGVISVFGTICESFPWSWFWECHFLWRWHRCSPSKLPEYSLLAAFVLYCPIYFSQCNVCTSCTPACPCSTYITATTQVPVPCLQDKRGGLGPRGGAWELGGGGLGPGGGAGWGRGLPGAGAHPSGVHAPPDRQQHPTPTRSAALKL